MERAKIPGRYSSLRAKIERRLLDFEEVGKSGGEKLFEELAFCILTPQSKARSCYAAISNLKEGGLLFAGSHREVARVLAAKTRFHNNKARYLVEAREKFAPGGFAALAEATFSGSEREARARLLEEVKGIGLKEASHYLRNVGRGKTLAILDRHILKNLRESGAIDGLPKSLAKKAYFEIEGKMREFCEEIGVPLAHLDLLFWAEETGEIFK